MVSFKTRNSVQDMVEVLKINGTLSENEINIKAFGYDRNRSFGSNKKYADMLRRGMKKGIIGRIGFPDNALKHGRTKFIYFATKPEIQIECSAELDNEWANESM
jgi:predicted transcriptional regulator